MGKYLLSCDWGSTCFRLRLVELPDQKITGEVFSEDGVIRTYNLWTTNTGSIDRKQFFLEQLKKQTDTLSLKLSVSLDNIPIVISGMASSSIGMQELPYALLPFAADGSRAGTHSFHAGKDFPNEIILISGVRSQEDVMRGEETQLAGLIELLDLSGYKHQEAIILLPGTHSKHLHIRNGELISFQTFMTGELFDLLTHYSILKDSVRTTDRTEFSDHNMDAFELGVRRSSSSGILNSLFTVRTNQLFDKLNKEQNSFYLSGLLIGAELNHLSEKGNLPLILCSGGNLYEFYRLAFQELGLLERTITISADMINRATIAGQIIILKLNPKYA